MDWVAIARVRTVEMFLAEYLHPFLLATVALVRPALPQRPNALELKQPTQPLPEVLLSPQAPPQVTRLVLPVRKVQPTLPSMISIGRTPNNDIVIEDAQVSKLHALLRVRGDVLELEDAGSVNGTRLNDAPVPKGAARPVRSGDAISLGLLQLTLLDSAATWAALTKR